MRLLLSLAILISVSGCDKKHSSISHDYTLTDSVTINGTTWKVSGLSGYLDNDRSAIESDGSYYRQWYTRAIPGCSIYTEVFYYPLGGDLINLENPDYKVCTPANCTATASMTDTSGNSSTFTLNCSDTFKSTKIYTSNSVSDFDLKFLKRDGSGEYTIFYWSE